MAKPPRSAVVESAGYLRIGAVERLSGVPATTIRVWERRYQTLSPSRSARGGRLYSPADVERLSLLREVVEAGHAIGTVAGLANDELRARLRNRGLQPAASDARTCRAAVLGAALAGRLRPHLASVPQLQLIASVDALEGASDLIAAGAADVLLVEVPTLQAVQIRQLQQLLDQLRPRLLIVVYGFASHGSLRRLDDARVLALRAPAEPLHLLRLCLLALQIEHRPQADGAVLVERALGEAPVARQFSDEQLAALATLPNTIRCECPRHLADLLVSLSAFERYSAECEDLDANDAALHNMLRRTSGSARALLEQALQRVLRAEAALLK